MCTFIMAQGVFQLYQVGIIIIIYFTDMETEAGIGWATSPRFHSWCVAEWRFESRQSDSSALNN